MMAGAKLVRVNGLTAPRLLRQRDATATINEGHAAVTQLLVQRGDRLVEEPVHLVDKRLQFSRRFAAAPDIVLSRRGRVALQPERQAGDAPLQRSRLIRQWRASIPWRRHHPDQLL